MALLEDKEFSTEHQHRYRLRRYIIISSVILLVLACFELEESLWNVPTLPTQSRSHPSHISTSLDRTSIAHEIISKTFNETFALLQNFPENLEQKQMMLQILNSSRTLPWWFRTMLRDGTDYDIALDGEWHTLESSNPSIRMCTIEKVATTEWRKVFCYLNEPNTTKHKAVCNRKYPLEGDVSSFVFLRDPLERFLSGFLNKCWDERRREREPHCQPREIFKPGKNNLLFNISDKKKEFFAAYADTVPLKWNQHFFPQSLYCDGLYRHLPKYDFVGNMGASFFDDLRSVGQRYGQNFSDVVHKVFRVPRNRSEEEVFFGVETAAPKHVEEYYTPRSLKRVLDFVSIDYVLLNMTVPEWAIRMLSQ